jgi:hypothetical protein
VERFAHKEQKYVADGLDFLWLAPDTRATHFGSIVQNTSSDIRFGKKANPKGVLRGLMADE